MATDRAIQNLMVRLNGELQDAEHNVVRLRSDLVRLAGLEGDKANPEELLTLVTRLVRAIDRRDAKQTEYDNIRDIMAGL